MKLKNLLYGIFAATIAATAVSAMSVVASADAGDSYGPYTLTIDHDFPSDKVHFFALNLMKSESTDTDNDCNWNYDFKNVELKLDGKAVDTSSCAGYTVANVVKFAENWSGEESIEGLGDAKSIQVTFDLVDKYGSGVPDAYICTSIKDGNWGGSPSVKLLTPTTEEETSISLDQTTLSLKAGETATLKATTTPADAEVTWKSSDEKVATVKNGVVTTVAAGKATITATAGEKSAECAVTVTDDSGKDNPGEVTTSDYALLYDEELEVTVAYENAQIPVKAVAGDKITVTYKLNDAGAYHQLSFKHAGEGWPALTSPEYTNEWNCVDVSKDGTFTFTLNAEDAANITANKLVISGYSVTYTKVELNADKKPDDKPDASSGYDTLKEEKVSDFKTDGTSELHVKSITADDVKDNSAYEIKVTLSNGKSLTKTTSKCFKKFKYVNTSGDTVTESSSDNYFIVVKIINIPAGVTVDSVTITPVAN